MKNIIFQIGVFCEINDQITRMCKLHNMRFIQKLIIMVILITQISTILPKFTKLQFHLKFQNKTITNFDMINQTISNTFLKKTKIIKQSILNEK